MPASPKPTVTPRSGRGVPKLRSSCDACGTAKIRCDRGKPECGRCVADGLSCVYGRSRKNGKPPRKRLGLAGYPRNTIECTHMTTDAMTDVLPEPVGIIDMLDIATQPQLGPSLSMPMFDEWPQFDIFGAGLDFPCLPKATVPDIRHSVSTWTTGSRQASSNHDSHSCPRDSYEILADLVCPSPSLHAPTAKSDTVSAKLDLILHCNKSAIDRLSRVLKCPCAKSGHRVMVHASIISRILIWYQQAAGWTGKALADPLASRPMSSSSATAAGMDATSQSIYTQTTGFAVADVPVAVGTFNIEDENLQATFRNQVILSELKTAAKLIDLFTSQDSSDSCASSMASLYSYLGAWLRSEHSKIVTNLRSRLSVPNEELDS